MSGWEDVARAVTALLQDLDGLASRAVDAIQAEIVEYTLVPRQSLEALVRGNLATALHAYRDRRSFDDDDIASIIATVGQRAAQGVPLDALLRAFSLVDRTGFDNLFPLLEGADVNAQREVWQIRWSNADRLLRAAASAHRRVELEQTAESQARLALTLQSLLGGELAEAKGAAALSRLGMDPLATHWVWCVRPHGDVTDFLHKVLGGPERAPKGVFTVWDRDIVGITAVAPAPDLSGADGSVEGPVPVTALHTAFQRARHAAATARAFALGGIQSRAQLGLLGTVTSDPEAGGALERRYVLPLDVAGPLASDLLRTVQVHLENGRRRETTASILSLHPNTVSYRLSRFTLFTGADLEDHRVIAELWWLFRHLEASP